MNKIVFFLCWSSLGSISLAASLSLRPVNSDKRCSLEQLFFDVDYDEGKEKFVIETNLRNGELGFDNNLNVMLWVPGKDATKLDCDLDITGRCKIQPKDIDSYTASELLASRGRLQIHKSDKTLCDFEISPNDSVPSENEAEIIEPGEFEKGRVRYNYAHNYCPSWLYAYVYKRKSSKAYQQVRRITYQIVERECSYSSNGKGRALRLEVKPTETRQSSHHVPHSVPKITKLVIFSGGPSGELVLRTKE